MREVVDKKFDCHFVFGVDKEYPPYPFQLWREVIVERLLTRDTMIILVVLNVNGRFLNKKTYVVTWLWWICGQEIYIYMLVVFYIRIISGSQEHGGRYFRKRFGQEFDGYFDCGVCDSN